MHYNRRMAKQWTPPDVLQLSSSFQGACVLAAAAELDLFTALSGGPLIAAQAAGALACDLRGITVLLDALTALGLLDKHGDVYEVPQSVRQMLAAGSPGSILAMAQHQANCLRRWSQLAAVVKSGKAADRRPSIRGEDADYASFIEAMDNINRSAALPLVQEIQSLACTHLLDIGGGSGTWTIAFLKAHPQAVATIFDLPHVIPQARDRVAAAGLDQRVKLVAGDFYADALPPGADLALLSAIVHQNSRRQNRELFAKVHSALVHGGRVLIRDFVMDSSRIAPAGGALFAVNMLVGTEGGGTFTFEELREDLASAGLAEAQTLKNDGTMNSLVLARKPQA